MSRFQGNYKRAMSAVMLALFVHVAYGDGEQPAESERSTGGAL